MDRHARSNPGNVLTAGWPEWLNSPLAARASLWLGGLLVAAAVLNAWSYSSTAAGPLLQADAWYFLDVFVSKYLDGTLGIWDLFVQRGGSDHAQPLQKLILLFHTRYFDMDFRVEGLIGTALGIAWCVTIALAVYTGQRRDRSMHVFSPAVISLVFVLGLSINSTNVFTWSLVTLIYVTLLASTLYFLAAMRLVRGRFPWLLAPVGLLQGLLIDEVAIIVFVASVIAVGLFSPASRRNKLLGGTAALGGLLLARLVLYLVSSRNLDSTSGSTSALFEALFSLDALKGVVVPFSDSLVHVEHLQRFFPESYGAALVLLAAFVMVLHGYFWVVTFNAIRQDTRSSSLALAVFLMLVSYALTAGIIVGRVPTFGWGYLHQPRYVLFYQLGLVAIAIMFVHRLGQGMCSSAARRRSFASVEAIGILLVSLVFVSTQLIVTRESWNVPRYLTPYWQNASFVMQRLADDPSNVAQCPDILSVCEYAPEQRERLMGLLVQRQLNIFSPAFQIRNRLYSSLESVPGLGVSQDKPQAEEISAAVVAPVGAQSVGIVIEALPGAEGCDDTSAAPLVRIRLNPGNAKGPIQLWSDGAGQQRKLLAEHGGDEATVNVDARLESGATLSVLAANNQQVLARASFAPIRCDP